MEETKPQKPAAARSRVQSFIMYFCIAGTLALAAACALFASHYSKYESMIEGRVIVLKGAEPPAAGASYESVRKWLGEYSPAMPGCLCTMSPKNPKGADSALLLCVGFTDRRGGTVCVMKPEKLPRGVTMDVSSHEKLNERQKVLFLLDRIFFKDLVSPRMESM